MLTNEERLIVQRILQRYLPEKTSAWVFGSRAQGPARKFSDLDLLFDYQGKTLPSSVLTLMTDAFDNSALPYSVDLIDWNTCSDRFKQKIQRIEFPLFSGVDRDSPGEIQCPIFPE